jgi:methylase of polypeptide subunit release factors
MDEQPFFNEAGIPIYRVKGGLRLSIATKNHPDLIPFLRKHDPPSIDNLDREALLLYNYYIAKDVYGLEIKFEEQDAIIPTPVMRYNFLLYLLKPNSTVIELGTGASAIIAMLAAKHFNARVWATEMDPQYIEIAKENIHKNGLDQQITVIDSKGKYLDGVFAEDFKVDYIISNPPYYDKIRSPKILWGGRDHELISGEFGEEFCIRMLEEGWNHLNNPGMISFIIPKTRPETLVAIEEFLNKKGWEYDLFGLQAGNRVRFVFRVYRRDRIQKHFYSEMDEI